MKRKISKDDVVICNINGKSEMCVVASEPIKLKKQRILPVLQMDIAKVNSDIAEWKVTQETAFINDKEAIQTLNVLCDNKEEKYDDRVYIDTTKVSTEFIINKLVDNYVYDVFNKFYDTVNRVIDTRYNLHVYEHALDDTSRFVSYQNTDIDFEDINEAVENQLLLTISSKEYTEKSFDNLNKSKNIDYAGYIFKIGECSSDSEKKISDVVQLIKYNNSKLGNKIFELNDTNYMFVLFDVKKEKDTEKNKK